MAIHYTLTVDGDTLRVQASGFDENLTDVEAYGTAIIRACLEHDVTCVLCDEHELEYRLSTFDTYQAAEFMAKQVPTLVRAAVVCNPKYLAMAHFWEDVAVNRNLQVRVFTDTPAALSWLQSGV
jgi:hypothetical protein